MGDIVVIRHGQTEWSANGRHTSYTDLELTPDGERQARGLAGRLATRTFAAVISSPRKRALRTAELIGLRVNDVDESVAEWHYGEYEGLTTPQIRKRQPGWSVWTHGCPGGESPARITARIDGFLARVRPLLRTGDVAVISHGHTSRALAARWVAEPVTFGGRLHLDTATLSVLGFEHELQALRTWNAAPS